jgi:deoxyribonuclease-4
MTRFTFPDAPGDLLGAHISTQGGLHTVFERAKAIKATALAMFAKNSNQWKGKELTDEAIATFNQLRNVRPIVTHASYLINLATTNPLFHTKSIAAMIDELDRAERLNIHAVVLHPGAHLGAGPDAGLDQIARSLDQIHASIPNHRVATLLETAAGQGSCLGCTFEELGRVLELVDDKQRVGICIDTCHVFAAGHDLAAPGGMKQTLDELVDVTGKGRLKLIHANDSKDVVGAHKDRHANIGAGHIGEEPFRELFTHPATQGVPLVIETPGGTEGHAADVARLKALRDG